MFIFRSTSQPPNILFSYKAQVDADDDDDILSLPNQRYAPAPHKPPEEEGAMSRSYDSTHFDAASPNPLYDNLDDHGLGINSEVNFSQDYFSSNPGRIPGDLIAETFKISRFCGVPGFCWW